MIKVLDKVDNLLEMVGKYAPVSFTELQQFSGLNKATLSQILKSMTELDWITRDEEGKFRIGRKFEAFAKNTGISKELKELFSKTASELSSELNELVTISMFYSGERHVVAKYEVDHFVKIQENTSSEPSTMLSTATGLVLLSNLDSETREIFIKRNGFENEIKETEATLEKIRKEGFAEQDLGNGEAFGLATGIYDSNEKIIAALGFTAPCYRFKMEKTEAVAILRKYADEITKKLT